MSDAYKKLTLSPYFFLVPSVNEMLFLSTMLLIPQVIMLFITKSKSSLILLVTIILASIISDLLEMLLSRRSFKVSWIPVFQGLIIAFFIPSEYPILLAFCITVPSLLLYKYSFGGFAQGWVNPIAVTVILMYFLGSQYFPSFILTPSFLQSTNAGAELFSQGLLQPGSYDEIVSTALNDGFLSKCGISIPSGYITLFWDTGSTIPAFRFNLLTLIASLFLFTGKIIDGVIPIVFLFVYGCSVAFFGLYPYGGIFGSGDILLALLTSGTLFATVFMFEWFGTHPQSFAGKFVYGALIGIIAFFITGCGTSPIGIIFTTLVANVISPYIQSIERSICLWKTKKRLLEVETEGNVH